MKGTYETAFGRAVRAMGLNFKELAAKIDPSERFYRQFEHSRKTGKWTLGTLHQICFITGRTFEELFPSPLSLKPQKIELNLASTAAYKPVKTFRRAPKEKEKPVAVTPPAPSLELPSDYVDFSKISVPLVEDQKLNEDPRPAKKEFKVIDVYDEGLPPASSDE